MLFPYSATVADIVMSCSAHGRNALARVLARALAKAARAAAKVVSLLAILLASASFPAAPRLGRRRSPGGSRYFLKGRCNPKFCVFHGSVSALCE